MKTVVGAIPQGMPRAAAPKETPAWIKMWAACADEAAERDGVQGIDETADDGGAPTEPTEDGRSAAKPPLRPITVLGIALLQALVFAFVLFPVATYGPLPAYPGVGVSVVALVSLVAMLVVTRHKGRFDKVTIPLIMACVVLSVLPALYMDAFVNMLTTLLLWLVFTLTAVLVGRVDGFVAVRMRQLLSALGFFFRNLFRYIGRPTAVMRATRRAQGHAVSSSAKSVIGGCIAAVVVLVIVLPLLASADTLFGSLLPNMTRFLENFRISDVLWDTAGRIVLLLIAFPLLFSLLYALHLGDNKHVASTSGKPSVLSRVPALSMLIVVVAVDVAYALFAAVQVMHLLDASVPDAGYAAYARSGFFELVVVAVINLAVSGIALLSSRKSGGSSTALRVATALLTLLSMVILASAAWRMSLYVQEYGLTQMRCFTYLIMAFILVMFVAQLIKTFAKKLNLFAVGLAAAIILWCGFAASNVDARIAEYNVSGYEQGALEELDLWYLMNLSADTMPIVEGQAHASKDQDLINQVDWYREWTDDLPWQAQSISLWMR